MWSYETLGTRGHPRYAGTWGKVGKMEQTGPRSVRFTFDTPDRELAMLMGMRPVLKKAQWRGRILLTRRSSRRSGPAPTSSAGSIRAGP